MTAAKHGRVRAAAHDATGDDDPLRKSSIKLECASKIINSAKAFALLPDPGQIQALDGKKGFSVTDLWHYEFDRWGIVGRAITIVALMFGAQFWFDVLRRLVGLRTSVGGGLGSGAG